MPQVAAACEDAPASQIAVTYGIDTMVDTARILSEDQTIVLAGAARPQLMRRSDADFNLGAATATVQTFDDGVYVSMSGRVYNTKTWRRPRAASLWSDNPH